MLLFSINNDIIMLLKKDITLFLFVFEFNKLYKNNAFMFLLNDVKIALYTYNYFMASQIYI